MADSEKLNAIARYRPPLCPLTEKARAGAVLFSVMLAATMIDFTPALAGNAPLDAAYGNRDGCLYANTGESTGSDDFFLLTGEAITTAASYCEFKSISGAKDEGFGAALTCQEEGGGTADGIDVEIVRSAEDSYKIVFPDGNTWGPLKKCR